MTQMNLKKERGPLFEAAPKDDHDFKPHASIDMSEDANNISMQVALRGSRISIPQQSLTAVASGGGNRSLKN